MRAEWIALAIVVAVIVLAFAGGMALRAYHLPEVLIGLIGALAAGAFWVWMYRRRKAKGP